MIDAYSKWIEVIPMNSTTTTATVERLRVLFVQFGISEVLVSDNGTNFVSKEFEELTWDTVGQINFEDKISRISQILIKPRN